MPWDKANKIKAAPKLTAEEQRKRFESLIG